MKGKLLFLGTGGSVGVPVIGCSCEVCHSNDPTNKRLRPSALLRIGQRQFLIDAGPDFRLQALREGITKLDGLLLTHAHHDHTAGLDDLRPIYYRRPTPLPVLLSPATAQDIKMRFYYLFESEDKNFISRLHLQLLSDQTGSTFFEDLPIQYVTFMQGGMLVNGYRIGNLAYLSDIRHFSPSIFEDLKGVRYLIISALRYTPSPLHFSVDEAIDFANQLKVEKVWLTHISHELEHHQTNAYLPPHMRLAYDGLEIDFD
jgi:phosphoribosyl 1,2-cyclic phosphate phosphodiesterase